MTRRHVAGTRRRVAAPPGTGRASGIAGLNLFQLVALWRLARGGISPADGAKLLGVTTHSMAAKGAVDAMDTVMLSPLPLNEPVRCRGCGALITQIPCLACRGTSQSYRMPERRHSA